MARKQNTTSSKIERVQNKLGALSETEREKVNVQLIIRSLSLIQYHENSIKNTNNFSDSLFHEEKIEELFKQIDSAFTGVNESY